MSAKKTVRHIQNNFRLTTKLLSDSNILPVSKVLLKNNFPTYELPLHNPNSRPKKKKANIDCPPCPPVDCPEPKNNYAGQTSYLHPRSRLYPNSKLNPRSKLYPRSKWEPKKKEINEYFEKLENEKDISDEEKDYILSEQDYQEEYEKQEVELGFDPKKAALLADFFSKFESGQLSKPKDNQEYSQTKKYSFGNPRKSSQSKRHTPTIQSSAIFGQQDLEESAYIDDDGNYIPEKKKFNSLTEYKSECEYVDKKSLFKQMDEQFHQSNEEELTYRLFQNQFEYFDLKEIGRYQGMFGLKELIEPRKQYLKGYELVSEYNTNIKYKEIGADLLPKKDNAYYRLYTNCKNFIVERFYKIGSTENKNEFTHPLSIDKYFEIINPVDKASSNSTENQSYSIAFDLGRKSAIAKLPQDYKRDPKWNQLLKEVADRIRDQKINKPLHEVLPVLIKNWNDGWINQKYELDRVAEKVYDKVVKDKYGIKEKVPTDKSISFDKFDTIEFADLIRKNILTQNSKIDNRRINSFFESTYINLKSEKFIKEIQESFELALVKHCRQIFFEKIIDLKYEKRKEVANELHKKIFDRILDTYNNQPVLNVRTSESVQNQAYSTPIPLGYLISFYLGLYEQQNRSVFEPCAGNGSLLIAAHLDNVTANELHPIRVKHLESHGFRVEPGNALDYTPNRKFARIVMNPPFGIYPTNKHIKINGKAITQIDQAIAIHSLQYLEPNGIAAIILGGHTLTKDPRGGFKSTDQFFHNHLYRNYDILKCIDINGDLYRKQGTSFDIRLIILRNSNTQEYKHILPYQYGDKPGQVLKANTWEDLYNFLSPENISKSAITHENKKLEMSSEEIFDLINPEKNYSQEYKRNLIHAIETGKEIRYYKNNDSNKISIENARDNYKIIELTIRKIDKEEVSTYGTVTYTDLYGKIIRDRDLHTFKLSEIKPICEKYNLVISLESQKTISSINDIPKIVRQFMPLHQQKAIVGNKELGKVLHDLERQILNAPKTYETEDIRNPEKILQLHYFYGDTDWYIVEKDKLDEQLQAYGYVIFNGDTYNAELGYINIEELKNSNKVELDIYWTPIKLRELNKTENEGENNEDRDERDQENSSNANRESGRMVGEWNEQGSDQGHRGYSGVTGSARSGTQDRYDDGESGHSERNSKELTKGRKGTSGNSSVSQRDGMLGESNNADIQSDISKDDFEFDPKKAAMMAAFFEKMNIS